MSAQRDDEQRGPERPTVIYDGGCGMCTRSARLIAAFDWLRRMETVPFDEAATRFPDVAAAARGEGVRFRHADGRMLVAFPAARAAMLRTPAGAIPALALHLPGLRRVGAWGYGILQARRERTTTTCDVSPPPGAASPR